MEEKVLVLRCCAPNLTSYGGFKWPEAGPVECPDWDSKPECGNGLHGWLWGTGDFGVCDFDYKDLTIIWLVVEVLKSDIIDLEDKVKFPKGNVVYCGSRNIAVQIIADKAPKNTPIMFLNTSCQYNETVYGGAYSKISGWIKSNISVGDYSVASSSSNSILTGGDYSFLSGNNNCILKGGENSVLVAGYDSNITGGNNSKMFGGVCSIMIGGYNCTFTMEWFCEKTNKRGVISAIVNTSNNENLKPHTAYRVEVTDGVPKFVEV